MDIWIIQEGEKVGPIHDFELRRRIESGELKADTPAWHEGLDAWRPLREIQLFKSEFERPVAPPAPQVVADEPTATGPVRAAAHPLRRFWARWFDLYLFAGVWWFALWAAGLDIGAALANPWLVLFQYVPWFVIESILLQRFGTTPGKWLLGLKLVNDDGSAPSFAATSRRSARVLFLGIGLGWGVLALICQLLAFFTTKRLGRPLWDHAGGHRLKTSPLRPLRIVVYAFGLFAALQLQMSVVAPYVMESMRRNFPALHEQMEKSPPWHLPKRH
jgi:uncharacterized RDD family membrane protein YckC